VKGDNFSIFSDEEKAALEEIRQLAEVCDIVGAVRKARETFKDPQGVSAAVREIITEAVKKGQPLEKVFEDMQKAISTIEDCEQRRHFETAKENYRQMIEIAKEAIKNQIEEIAKLLKDMDRIIASILRG
jgi:phosphoenolpyruvate carboxylase